MNISSISRKYQINFVYARLPFSLPLPSHSPQILLVQMIKLPHKLGYWAHARRKFFEARKENEKWANEALFYIGKLYEVESEADALDEKDKKPDYDRRKRLRQEKAYPEIKKFEAWMEVNLFKCGPKSMMEDAISYTYKILKKLSLYTTDGRYKIDDNMVENSIRPLAIGRLCGVL